MKKKNKQKTKKEKSTRPEVVELSFIEQAIPEEIFAEAEEIAKKQKRKLKQELENVKPKLGKVKTLDEFLSLPIAVELGEEAIVWKFAILISILREALKIIEQCGCDDELKALQMAMQRVQNAQNALQQAQNALAADQAQLAAAQARERAAWNAYQAAVRARQRVCGGLLGKFDPLCLVAITYETFLGNIWSARQRAVQAWQKAVQASLRLVAQRRAQLERALRAYSRALWNFIWCMIRCFLGM